MTDYNVTAKRWGSYWELHIDGVGVTQTRTLAGAEHMIRDYLDLDGHPDPSQIHITVELDGNLANEAEAAREANRQAELARDAAATRFREVVRALKAAGLSGNDIASVLKVSPQRVSQLVNS